MYHSNPELSLALKLIPALAFEKLENVKSSFKLVIEDIQEICKQLSLDSSEVEKTDELCSYFQNTTIEKNSREPLFPPSIWNKKENRRKKYRELEAKVKIAIERHQDENIVAFLRAMASLSMPN